MAGVRAVGLSWLWWLCCPAPLPAHALLVLTLNLLDFGQPSLFRLAQRIQRIGSKFDWDHFRCRAEVRRGTSVIQAGMDTFVGPERPPYTKVTESMENLAPLIYPARSG